MDVRQTKLFDFESFVRCCVICCCKYSASMRKRDANNLFVDVGAMFGINHQQWLLNMYCRTERKYEEHYEQCDNLRKLPFARTTTPAAQTTNVLIYVNKNGDDWWERRRLRVAADFLWCMRISWQDVSLSYDEHWQCHMWTCTLGQKLYLPALWTISKIVCLCLPKSNVQPHTTFVNERTNEARNVHYVIRTKINLNKKRCMVMKWSRPGGDGAHSHSHISASSLPFISRSTSQIINCIAHLYTQSNSYNNIG